MDDTFDVDGHLIIFPLWVIRHQDFSLGGFITATNPDGHIATPLFTDKPAAELYLEASPASVCYTLTEISEPLMLLGLLELLKDKTYTHFALDPFGSRARPIGIQRMRFHVLSWFASIPNARYGPGLLGGSGTGQACGGI